MSLADVLDRLDKLPEPLVMRALGRLFDQGGRGLFNSKFVRYEQLKELGYKGLKALIQNICELDEDFIKHSIKELRMLADLTERLLSNPEPEPKPEPAVPVELLSQGETHGIGRLDDFERDPFN